MTGFLFGSLFGYLLGNIISDSIWKGMIEEEPDSDEWVEEVPQRHYKKKRRYS
jgi:membrane protein YqaA with SNARE-associated domain